MCKVCLADVTAAIDRPKVFGNFNAICSLGFVVGPVIGGHLGMTDNGFLIVMTLQSLTFLFMAVFAGFVLKKDSNKTPVEDKPVQSDCIETSADKKTSEEDLKIHGSKYTDNFILSEEKNDEAVSTKPKSSSKGNTFLSKLIHFFRIDSLGSMVDILLLRFFLGFSMIIFRSNFTTMLEYRYQTTPKTNGYIMSYNGVVSGSCGVLVGYIMPFYNHRDSRALLHFSVMLASCIFCITYSPDLWMLLAFSAPLSLSTAISRVCVTNLTLTRGHKDERGVLLGVGNSLLSFARMLSPLIGGLALEFSVYGPGTISVIVACIGVAIVAFPIQEKEKADELRKEQ
jgi:MFS family permease